MEFIQHTINWIEGEIFEAKIFGSFGLLTIICSLLFWKFGGTPNSKAIVVPLAIVGLFFAATAISTIIANNKRAPQYTEMFYMNKVKFLESEKKRVEDFQYLYKMTMIIAAVCFIAAIGFFLFTNNHILRAIGIALIIFGLTGLIIDYFSKERADHYYNIITSEIKNR